MKSRFLFWAFVVTFAGFTQLLVYYANPQNYPILENIVKSPTTLAYNIVIFIAVVFVFIWLIRQIFKEDRREKKAIKKEQDKRDRKLVKAFKRAILKALKEDRERGAK